LEMTQQLIGNTNQSINLPYPFDASSAFLPSKNIGTSKHLSVQRAKSNGHAKDVLLGRGARINSHEGNRVFRSIVRQIQPFYIFAPKFIKQKIALDIIKIIQKRGGKFLQEVYGQGANVTHEETPPDNEEGIGRALNSHAGKAKHYEEVDFELALSKVSQTLREGLVELRGWMNTVRECFHRLRRCERCDSESKKKNLEELAGTLQKAPTEEHLHIFFRVILFEEPCEESFHEMSWQAYNLALPQLQRKSDIGDPLSLLRSMDLSDMDMLFLRAMGKKRCDDPSSLAPTNSSTEESYHSSNLPSLPLLSAANSLAFLSNAPQHGPPDTATNLQYRSNNVDLHEIQQPLQLMLAQMSALKRRQRLQDLLSQEQQYISQLFPVEKDSIHASKKPKAKLLPQQHIVSNMLPSQMHRIQGGMMQRKLAPQVMTRQMSSSEVKGVEQNHVMQNMVPHSHSGVHQSLLEITPSILLRLQNDLYATSQQYSNSNAIHSEGIDKMPIDERIQLPQDVATFNIRHNQVSKRIDAMHDDAASNMLLNYTTVSASETTRKKDTLESPICSFKKFKSRKRVRDSVAEAKECKSLHSSSEDPTRGNSKTSGLEEELKLWNQRPKTKDLQALRREYFAASRQKGGDESKITAKGADESNTTAGKHFFFTNL
jgi:hypothetical protein